MSNGVIWITTLHFIEISVTQQKMNEIKPFEGIFRVMRERWPYDADNKDAL